MGRGNGLGPCRAFYVIASPLQLTSQQKVTYTVNQRYQRYLDRFTYSVNDSLTLITSTVVTRIDVITRADAEYTTCGLPQRPTACIIIITTILLSPFF